MVKRDLRPKSDNVLVYSSDTGRICGDCQKPAANCVCRAERKKMVLGDGNVRVRRELKGRGGKTVTTISGLALDVTGLETLHKELKRRCGSGGTVKDGVLEIQGDHCDVLLAELAKRGIQAKRAGG